MTITEFVEKAVAGGWFPKNSNWTTKNPLSWRKQAVAKIVHKERIFLDPLAWKAVGKVEGWEPNTEYDLTAGEQFCFGEWYEYMHDMLDALAEGKTTEQYLETL